MADPNDQNQQANRPMTDLQSRVIRGGLSYFLRQVSVWGLQLASSLLILRWLSASDFGYVATVNLVLGVAQILAEGGLSVYLVQRVDAVRDDVLSEIASLQLFIYVALHIIASIILLVWSTLQLDATLVFFLWVALFTVPLSIFKANSFVGLERDLAFGKIAIIETFEALIFAVLSLVLAAVGMGVWSIILASITRAFIGWRLALRYRKWRFCLCKPRFTEDLLRGLRFGINYHMPGLITLVRVAVNPILVGGLLGMSAVGIADRAVYIAGFPLFFLGAVQQRVLFPYFARIQTKPDLVRSHFEKSYYVSAVLDKILYIPLLLFMPRLIYELAPRWSEAVPLIYVVMIGNIMLGSLSFSANPVFNGLGRADVSAKLAVFAMVVSWIVTWPLIKAFGVIGYAYVSPILWVSGSVPGIILLKRNIQGVSLRRPFLIPLLASAVSCAIVWSITRGIAALAWPLVIVLSLLGVGLYLVGIVLLEWRLVRTVPRQMRTALTTR